MDHINKEAPGAPGMEPKWTSSSKSGVGKSLNAASTVAFTLSHGILNEVYYPREDIACIRDMELLVTDDNDGFYEEKRDANHELKMTKPGIPAYEIKNSARDNSFVIEKEVVADPYRNTVLQRIKFKPKQKNSNHSLYALLAPHINNQGEHNTGWAGEYKGIPMLFARNGGIVLAFACSTGWTKRSVGFVGASDGWTDLHGHKEMTWEYGFARDGNIALTGEMAFPDGDGTLLALSFGRSAEDAANHARASLLDGFDKAWRCYVEEWEAWHKTLRHVSSKNYRISAAVLRMHEANNFPGGVIASLSIPWGDSKGDADKGGYHLVWPRDLVESAGGFLALRAKEDVLRILNYLMSTQNDDGSWPQNMWLHGEPNWTGLQMDQVALPVLELFKCQQLGVIDDDRMARYWPLAKKALAFLLKHGPYTQEDRWEEESGFTPFTMATEIAGLLAGAELAELNGDDPLAKYCRQTADFWNDAIETRTYVVGTQLAKDLGVEGYYIRINPYWDIAADDLGDRFIDLKNHRDGKGRTKINELVSVDALALTRFGLRAADDPKIRNTVKVIDALLKTETPNGPCWHRYNNDGYGEHQNGDPYDGTGIGRAWPLLTGERGHYEVACGNVAEAKKLLKSMEDFSHYGLLPEQIWDSEDIPEKRLFRGRYTGSAMPLTWANAEYLKLCASIGENRVFDMPKCTEKRYVENKTQCGYEVWRFDRGPVKPLYNKYLRIEIEAPADVVWTDDAWKTKHSAKTTDTHAGIFVADLKRFKSKANKIEFTFHWHAPDKWEGSNYSVSI